MKSLRKKVEIFCYKHPHFGIPNLMRYIVIITGVVFLISMMDTTSKFEYFLAFSPALILKGQVWRIITWIFLPINGNILYTAIALYFYFFIGSTLERAWGTGKFTIYYLLGMLLQIVYAFIMYIAFKLPISITASYLNLSMFFAFAALYPDERVLLFFIIPIKMKWLALVDAAFFIVSIIRYLSVGLWFFALMPIVAMLGFFLFCGDQLFYSFRRTRAANFNSNVINFKNEARKMKREEKKEEAKPYHHKCCVCGKTDTDYPDLEFRYCSRCAGYHCFCMDHINNHVHFTE